MNNLGNIAFYPANFALLIDVGFTAVRAEYPIMKLTERYGGDGWGIRLVLQEVIAAVRMISDGPWE